MADTLREHASEDQRSFDEEYDVLDEEPKSFGGFKIFSKSRDNY